MSPISRFLEELLWKLLQKIVFHRWLWTTYFFVRKVVRVTWGAKEPVLLVALGTLLFRRWLHTQLRSNPRLCSSKKKKGRGKHKKKSLVTSTSLVRKLVKAHGTNSPKQHSNKTAESRPPESAKMRRKSEPSFPYSKDRLLEFLSRTKFAACMGGELFLSNLYPLMERRILEKENVVFQADVPTARGLYIVVRGNLGVFDKDGHLMTEICRGESFGDPSLIDSAEEQFANRTSCRVITKICEVYFLSRERFEELCAEHPIVFYQFVCTVIGRQWRVASFVLDQFLNIPSNSREELQGPANVASVLNTDPHELNSANQSSREFQSKAISMKFSAAASIFVTAGEILFRAGKPIRRLLLTLKSLL